MRLGRRVTPLQLKEVVQEVEDLHREPDRLVTVTNSYRVFVSGEVKTPVYRIRSETSLLQIIPMAGRFHGMGQSKENS